MSGVISQKGNERMKRVTLISTLVLCAATGAVLFLSPRTVAQQSTIYNPYPSGILPPDLVSEIARVRREVASIEAEALAQAAALPPPVLTGQPPILQGTGQRANQLLGKLMNFDENISPFKTRACAFCHDAIRWVWRTDPISQSHNDRVSRIRGVQGRQADAAEIYVCALFPGAQLQSNPRSFLWRKFLGFTRNRI